MIDPGTIVDGRYEILRRVGSGGMADVYLASDNLLGRQVALKLLHHRFAEDQEFVERFKREASSAASLSHPNVVSIFDRGEWDGTYYIAMEYLPGRTLKAIVREHGALPPATAIDVVLQMLRAARFAHRRGVIHRDLKPHNVILDEEGRAKVTDFGIARAGASDMTLTGSIMGTAQYLSPEQAQGQAVSEASDLYAIGVVLYELLTGRVPFEGETAVTIALQHVSRAPRPPSTLNAAVPQALDAIVLRALEKDPAARYRSAEQAIAALDAVRATLLTPSVEHALGGAPPFPASAGRDSTLPAAADPTLPAVGPALAAGAAADAGLTASVAADSAPSAPSAPPAPFVSSPITPAPPPDANGASWQAATGQLPAYDPGAGPRGPAAAGAWAGSGAWAQDADGTIGTRDRRRRRRMLWASALLPLLIAAALIALLMPRGRVSVPGVVGERSAVAVAKLRHLGLRVAQSSAISTSVPAGRVVSQSPTKGRVVKPRSLVTIVVSAGAGYATVPRVAGLTEAQALQRLHEAGLRPSIRRRSSEEFKSGIAIGTQPPAGRSLAAGDRVWLTISSGPPQVQVPSVVGEPRAQAENQLEEAGLSVGAVTERSRARAKAGTVIAQSPRAGRQASTGASVRLVIAKAPTSLASVVVPSVIEDARESALATLRAAGLKPEVVSEAVFDASQVGYVVKQSPAAGNRARKGATVKVYVGVQQTTSTTSTSTTSQSVSQTSSQTSSTQPAQAAGG
jgi:eukaryotic-like serine/threonine-protein kinase